MSHAVESMAYAGQTPWHGLGFKVEPTLSPEEILKAAKIDWSVSKRKIFLENGKVIPNQFALTRDSDNQVLSMVGAQYKPVQNSDAMSFFKKFVDAGHMQMETAGSLQGGKFIWGLAKINKSFNVGRGDKIEGYLLMMSPHVFGYSMLFQTTAIRVVCWNTLNYALGKGLKGQGNFFRVHHAAMFDDKIKQKAEEALGLAVHQLDDMKQAFTLLSSKPVGEDDVEEYFFDVLAVKDEVRKEMEEGDKQAPRMLEKFLHALENAPGQDLKAAKGTLWGAFNAVTYVCDHESARTRDSGLNRAWFGDTARMKRRALELAVDRAA